MAGLSPFSSPKASGTQQLPPDWKSDALAKPTMEPARTILEGLSGAHGTIGLFGAFERVFLTFALFAGPACLVIDAPFGRFVPNRLTLDGNVCWILAEIVSPITFLIALSTPPASTPLAFYAPTLAALVDRYNAVASLPYARLLLVALYLCHYINRAVISTWRNPGRARIHISVVLSMVGFNLVNGYLLGTHLSAGLEPRTSSNPSGLQPTLTPLFLLGLLLFLTGFASNLYSDEILYRLKRSLPPPPPHATPRQRYAIPHGFLYSAPWGGISHPAYFCEWIEWTGFMLCTLALVPGAFPEKAMEHRGIFASLWRGRSDRFRAMVKEIPAMVRPLQGWYIQPPALFLWNELSAMLPRALSGHAWYHRVFRDEFPKQRKAVIPGLL